MLRVYADESGTGATSISGYVATPDYWIQFSKRWQKILNEFNAPYFHFREFSTKYLYIKPDCPYFRWSERKRDDFVLDLATLASEVAMPVGGSFAPKVGEKQTPPQIWKNSLVKFFEDLSQVLSEMLQNYSGKILFVFDRCSNKKKIITIREVHASFAEKDSRFGGLTFEDDTNPMHLPLQAADLCSYIERQYIEKLQEKDGVMIAHETRMLDMILLRNRHAELRKLNAEQWKLFITIVRNHRTQLRAEWKRRGIKQVYYPNKHFPWEKYGDKTRDLLRLSHP